MSEFVLYGIPGSPFVRSVAATLEEKGAGWRMVAVPPTALRTPEHLARHPFGRVPVLQHGGFTLFETSAILRYLDRVMPEPALTPGDPQAAARMDMLMSVTDCYVHPGLRTIIFQRIVVPLVTGGAPDEAAIAAALPEARAGLAGLAGLLGAAQYLAGDRPTLADLHLEPRLHLLSLTPEWAGLGAPHPALAEWLSRMEARPSFAATTREALLARLSAEQGAAVPA